MKKKNMRHMRRPQRPAAVRLSQCMIVKNEEKNIERALGWAKGIAFEQIVVDTGSTDRTAELAEAMGAKVVHFEWIDDFAAAKNFAIEQAGGNWIAFLDADEYLSGEDAGKLLYMLSRTMEDPDLRRKCRVLRCPWVQLDGEGKPFAVYEQDRVFRNLPEIRYEGRIHERLTCTQGVYNVPEVSILHTGYTADAFRETAKAARNLALLREELAARPDDPNLKCYVADSLRIEQNEIYSQEAETLFRQALTDGDRLLSMLKVKAYSYVIAAGLDRWDNPAETEALCLRAIGNFAEHPDFRYYYGLFLFNAERYDAAWEQLAECERILKSEYAQTAFIVSQPTLLFFYMLSVAQARGDMVSVIRCATLVLKEDRYQKGILTPYLLALKSPEYDTGDADILGLLGKLYDFGNIKDKLYILQAAKETGNAALCGEVYRRITPEEMAWLNEGEPPRG